MKPCHAFLSKGLIEEVSICSGNSFGPNRRQALTNTNDNPNLLTLICVTELILGLRPANERRRYNVTPSLIGWAQA